MKIPFNLLPASWGLKGKSRQIAEAEYYLVGYELDIKLAEIEHGNEGPGFDKRKILIDREYHRIDQYTADVLLSELEHTGNENAAGLTKLDIDLKYERISQQDFDRKRADLLGEPYMAMPKISWDPVDPSKLILNWITIRRLWNICEKTAMLASTRMSSTNGSTTYAQVY